MVFTPKQLKEYKEYKIKARMYERCAKGFVVDCSKCIGCAAKKLKN